MTGGGSTFVEGGLGVLPSGGTEATPLRVQGVETPTQKCFSGFNIKLWTLHPFNLIKLQEPDRSMNFGMNKWTCMFKKHESEVHAFASDGGGFRAPRNLPLGPALMEIVP